MGNTRVQPHKPLRGRKEPQWFPTALDHPPLLELWNQGLLDRRWRQASDRYHWLADNTPAKNEKLARAKEVCALLSHERRERSNIKAVTRKILESIDGESPILDRDCDTVTWSRVNDPLFWDFKK